MKIYVKKSPWPKPTFKRMDKSMSEHIRREVVLGHLRLERVHDPWERGL
jgi:hypothetical protein